MNKTNTDIIYMDHRTSAMSGINVEGTSKPDSLINIIKNRNVLFNRVYLQNTVLVKRN